MSTLRDQIEDAIAPSSNPLANVIAESTTARLKKQHIEKVLRTCQKPGHVDVIVDQDRRLNPFYNKMTVVLRRSYFDHDGKFGQHYEALLNVSPTPFANGPQDPRNLGAVAAMNQIASFVRELVNNSLDAEESKALKTATLRLMAPDDEIEFLEEVGAFEVASKMALDGRIGEVGVYIDIQRLKAGHDVEDVAGTKGEAYKEMILQAAHVGEEADDSVPEGEVADVVA